MSSNFKASCQRQKVVKLLSTIDRPKEDKIELKYKNTEKFVRFCLDSSKHS